MEILFGIIITILVYKIATLLKEKNIIPKIPPVLSSALLIILILSLFSIDYTYYKKGGDIILYFLGPATIALALPLIKNIETLKNNYKIILTGTLIATITGITSVLLLTKLLGATKIISLSLVPKSVTTPIAIEIAKSIGVNPAVTACMVAMTGVFGSTFGHKILKLLKINKNISIGLSMGASSHVFGTTKCVEKNELQAAVSTLSLILVGFLTAIFAPFLTKMFF